MASSPPCGAPAATPEGALRVFFRSAVERVNTRASYAVVSPSIRQGISCRQWATGTIPVQPFQSIDWQRSRLRVLSRTATQMSLVATLTSRLEVWGTAQFSLELRKVDDAWLVSYFASSAVFHAPSAR